MTFHRTIIYCTHTCKKKKKNTKCFILWVSLSVTTRSLPRPCVFCSASAWGKPNTHQTFLCLLIWVWVGLDRAVMPSEGREADPLWGLANSSCLSTQTPCPEIKGSSWYGKKKKKKRFSDLQYAVVCRSCTRSSGHCDKKHHHRGSYQPFWQLYLTEVYMNRKIISSAESL